MSTVSHDPPRLATTKLKVYLWGTESHLTQQVLSALQPQWQLTAVAVPAAAGAGPAVTQLIAPAQQTGELPLINHFVGKSTTAIAWQQGLPVYAIKHLRAPALVTWLQNLQPDLVCVTCFPWRIPAALLTIPTYGFLNLHPTRLPNYRGPAPLFWQLRDGIQASGVTIHWMDETFDTGAIAAQAPLQLTDGLSGPQADRAYGDLGAALFAHVLKAVAGGIVPRQPQPAGGSYQSWPQAADFALDPQWSAQHAFNFMRGTAEWQQPYQFATGARTIRLTHALDYAPEGKLAKPFVQAQGVAAIQFQPGVLRAQVL